MTSNLEDLTDYALEVDASLKWISNQVPIVASTGGLVDTVKEGFTGFQMGGFNLDVSNSNIVKEKRESTFILFLSMWPMF